MSAAQLFTSSSGWVLTGLLAATVALPYTIRNRSVRRGFAALRLPALRLHFWVGYVDVALTLAHSWVPMRPEIAGRANREGLYLATVALRSLRP